MWEKLNCTGCSGKVLELGVEPLSQWGHRGVTDGLVVALRGSRTLEGTTVGIYLPAYLSAIKALFSILGPVCKAVVCHVGYGRSSKLYRPYG